jgi:two-component system nitrogen regulation response regulator GlnG
MVNVDLTVLIEGESGTGKELIARALHMLGLRKSKPFVAVNMAAIPRELIESELFGHEKGAFTGAANRKAGKFEMAEGGTLFLDEIGDMPLEAQTRLLRVLQQGEYTPIGGSRTLRTDVRIICATHRDLDTLTKAGQFREDLFYRLNVVPIRVPPLRERKEDISELVQFFLKRARERGLQEKQISPEALELLKQYSWPGNVRELENLIYRLAAVYAEPVISLSSAKQELLLHHLRESASGAAQNKSLSELVTPYLKNYFQSHLPGLPQPGVYDRIIGIVEKCLIDVTLQATRGNQIRAAQILGINRNTLRKKIQEGKQPEPS